MYLSQCTILNSGGIANLKLKASFEDNTYPKPIILVGTNGSGKTGVLSTLADALLEIAITKFHNALPARGPGHQYFRILGGRSQRVGTSYELSVFKFRHGDTDIYYRAKAGKLSANDITDEMSDYKPVSNWSETGNEKLVVPDDLPPEILKSGAYVFFPSTRFEMPHWANSPALDRDPSADFIPNYADQLKRPIVVQSAIAETKTWIVDVMLDRSVDFGHVLGAEDLNTLKTSILQTHGHHIATYVNINQILSAILGNPFARLVRLERSSGERRICVVAEDNRVIIPSLDNLSAGQASLFSIFTTIARYGETGGVRSLDRMEGIVAVDEIDQHLHADLQHQVLPNLIKLFPRIQFVLSSHSPLFLLGMNRIFGEEHFDIIDMPSGLKIQVERFSEFENSFKYFEATKLFEYSVQQKLSSATTPLVLCEGETDPKYLLAAAEVLGFADLATKVEFDWVGSPSERGANGGGKSHLDDALKFLNNNPQFKNRSVMLLYDPETLKPESDHGNLFVRTLPRFSDAERKNGIENLLPASVFEDRFFDTKPVGKGDDKGSIRALNKTKLCDFLCKEKRDSKDFENFRDPLNMIRSVFQTVFRQP